MRDVHLVTGVAVLALNLAAGGWGGIAWIRQLPSVTFWYLLRVAQAAVALQTFLGAGLLLSGHEPADKLHYVYGVAPLVVTLFAEAARAGAPTREVGELDVESLPRERQRLLALAIVRRETGIMAASALVIFFLALRAAGTSGGF